MYLSPVLHICLDHDPDAGCGETGEMDCGANGLDCRRWTATRRDSETWDMYNGFYLASLCVRPIDPDLLQIAKDAQVDVPVADQQALKAYVPLNKARLAYEAGQYQESITQSRNALSMEPRILTAYWGIGISYGMLGHWDLAIANLNSAYKLDKMRGDVYSTLQWAKASKKAAKKGEKPKIKGKEWKSPEWKAPWS